MIRLLASLFSFLSLGVVFAVGLVAGVVQIYSQDLPSYQELRDYHPAILTRAYSGSGSLIAEYARKRRIFVPISEVPDVVKNAFVSAEDKHFYTHPGIDPLAIAKAIGRYAMARLSGHDARLAGASGITQQVVKNFLVGDERSVERKIREAILAVRVDGALSKDKILELYLNDIYMGARAYGIIAAAQNYFGKTLEELTPGEAAFLAALPKAPSHLNPIDDHDAAVARRNYVLGEMRNNGYLDDETYRAAVDSPLESILGDRAPTVSGNHEPTYFTDQVRRQLVAEVGRDELYHGGLTVSTTIDPDLQQMATEALRAQLEKFDRARGRYRGPVARIAEVAAGDTGDDAAGDTAGWQALLAGVDAARDITGWRLGVVLEVGSDGARVGLEPAAQARENAAPDTAASDPTGGTGDDAVGDTADDTSDAPAEAAGAPEIVRLTLARERQWIRRVPDGGAPGSAADIWQVGDVVYVEHEDDGWAMRQIPEVQGAFMAMDPDTGRVLALVGGFSYDASPFNRATQAKRQPGSSFKPFVYAAALDSGYTPDTIVLDAPVSIRIGGEVWQPKNAGGGYAGPLPLREGLIHSKNLMTVRVAQAVGMDRVAEYAERFGVYQNMPHHLAYSLGAGETTLYQMVAAYGMFANGGKRVIPTLIDRVQDRFGDTLYRHDPRFCQGCQVETYRPNHTPILFDARSQIMSPETAWELVSMLRLVVERGTASRAMSGVPFPLAGKTGTTNDSKDVWFIGFTRNLVAGCFMGYDDPRSLGSHAYGSTLCAPVFRQFITEAMETRQPGKFRPPPETGTVVIDVDTRTGERVTGDATGPFVVAQTYSTHVEPEILADDSLRLAADSQLFAGYGADLPYLVEDGADVPLGTGGSSGGGGGSTAAPGIGLGTGGVY